ncbi:hypothetical protein DZS_16830 [Dickeya ananatis]
MLHYNNLGFSFRWVSCLLLTLLALSGPALAHPHSFIDMKTTVEGKDDLITGLRMNWTMDPITSADLLYDAGNAAKDSDVWKKTGGRRDGECAGAALLHRRLSKRKAREIPAAANGISPLPCG